MHSELGHFAHSFISGLNNGIATLKQNCGEFAPSYARLTQITVQALHELSRGGTEKRLSKTCHNFFFLHYYLRLYSNNSEQRNNRGTKN